MRSVWNRVALLVGVLACSAGGAAAEDNPAVPTNADWTTLQQCLEGAREAGGSKDTCVGTVSGPCLDDPANSSTVMMGACADKEATMWDDLLNQYYGDLMKRLDGEQKQGLKQAQRAWLDMRDKTCAFEASLWGGGTGAGPASTLCYMRETGHRAVFLGEQLDFVSQ